MKSIVESLNNALSRIDENVNNGVYEKMIYSDDPKTFAENLKNVIGIIRKKVKGPQIAKIFEYQDASKKQQSEAFKLILDFFDELANEYSSGMIDAEDAELIEDIEGNSGYFKNLIADNEDPDDEVIECVDWMLGYWDDLCEFVFHKNW